MWELGRLSYHSVSECCDRHGSRHVIEVVVLRDALN